MSWCHRCLSSGSGQNESQVNETKETHHSSEEFIQGVVLSGEIPYSHPRRDMGPEISYFPWKLYLSAPSLVGGNYNLDLTSIYHDCTMSNC